MKPENLGIPLYGAMINSMEKSKTLIAKWLKTATIDDWGSCPENSNRPHPLRPKQQSFASAPRGKPGDSYRRWVMG
jgi:hypothetical protein